ncbi:hypothetical protein BO78DRAFT_392411 [Aspergillus sclerotiicarbonarius CBS 121057]|uniref:Uncharacterized protein n=1 Tax=Aspergillus sclerotiicarbonarius (strain CBS 121057 / IBT 28362) TaxID=1448318 RepID=A0A319FP84_ASPSB|nr:hypothetical protein BO78DRAFT_392411 [Aspergillus sclerotiicarbonarius CBS 121057]
MDRATLVIGCVLRGHAPAGTRGVAKHSNARPNRGLVLPWAVRVAGETLTERGLWAVELERT